MAYQDKLVLDGILNELISRYPSIYEVSRSDSKNPIVRNEGSILRISTPTIDQKWINKGINYQNLDYRKKNIPLVFVEIWARNQGVSNKLTLDNRQTQSFNSPNGITTLRDWIYNVLTNSSLPKNFTTNLSKAPVIQSGNRIYLTSANYKLWQQNTNKIVNHLINNTNLIKDTINLIQRIENSTF